MQEEEKQNAEIHLNEMSDLLNEFIGLYNQRKNV
jgi:hypothetical protein